MPNLTPEQGAGLRSDIVLAIASGGAHHRSDILTGGNCLIVNASWPADHSRIAILQLGSTIAALLGADTPFDLRLTSHSDRTVLRIEAPYHR